MRKNNKISNEKGKLLSALILLAVSFVTQAVPSDLSFAQELVKPEIVLPQHFPNGFDGYGLLQRIGRGEVVIDDQLLKLSPTIEYHTPTRMDASGAYFRPGVIVGFLRNSDNEIVSLWLIE
jgi:hypothetical protein